MGAVMQEKDVNLERDGSCGTGKRAEGPEG
jgi:hypothetical protein